MKRRRFIAAGCACCGALAGGAVLAQTQTDRQTPARFSRPDIATDEGGLWALMDREETRLRRSPFSLRDPELRGYVQGIACKLAGDHCPDVRVYVMKTPLFNASKRIVGQLHGGDALCDNNLSDWYGRLAHSWTGGGSPSTRLSDWLDPAGTGVTSLTGAQPGGSTAGAPAAPSNLTAAPE